MQARAASSVPNSPAHPLDPLHPLLDGERVGHRPARRGRQLVRVPREEAGHDVDGRAEHEPAGSAQLLHDLRRCETGSLVLEASGLVPSGRRRSDRGVALGKQHFERRVAGADGIGGERGVDAEGGEGDECVAQVVELGLAGAARPRRTQRHAHRIDGGGEARPRRVDPSRQLAHVGAGGIGVDRRIGRRLRGETEIGSPQRATGAEQPAEVAQERQRREHGQIVRRPRRVGLEETDHEVADRWIAVRPPPPPERERDAAFELGRVVPRSFDGTGLVDLLAGCEHEVDRLELEVGDRHRGVDRRRVHALDDEADAFGRSDDTDPASC